jgi:hypothetical protein
MEQHCACKKSAERPGALLRMTLDVVREKLGLPDVARGQIQIFPLPLPSEKSTALVDVVFSELNCRVSLMAPRCIHIEINKVDGEHTETVEFPPWSARPACRISRGCGASSPRNTLALNQRQAAS